jgi:hypothetical protein
MPQLNGTRWISETFALTAVVLGTAASVWGLTAVEVIGSPWITTAIAEPVMIAGALYAWHVHEKLKEADPERWMMGTIFAPLLGAISFAIDVFTGSTHGNYDNFFQAAFHAGGPFGIVVTVLICPIGTIICMGGWVRGSILERFGPSRKLDD